ncbi:hypothetical protein EIP91_008752 [Steccherinum ochraceum]|uniref:Uncharacterized protein n=1 Tax=Steccherinum ochraceum TaxID=92696 RepID=A0A4R0RKA5_9APHY|nr:hypothetical protein EIP91_008752 [Steccherinum ochraceum]
MTEPLRKPSTLYRGQNGFLDSIRLQVQGQAATAREAETKPTDKDQRENVLTRHFAQHILDTNGHFFPSMEVMQEIAESRETATTKNHDLADLQDKHYEDLDELYDYQAQQYLAEAVERYLSKDDTVADELYIALNDPHHPSQSAFTSQREIYDYAYLTSSLALRQRLEDPEPNSQDDGYRDSRFPRDVTQFRRIRNKDTLLRITRYLIEEDPEKKEQLRLESRWKQDHVRTVQIAYTMNSDFRTEVQNLLSELEGATR